MKIRIPLAFGVLMTLAATQVSAATINLAVGAGGVAGDHIIGEAFTRNDLPGGQLAQDVAIINALLPLPLNTRVGNDPEYFRSATNFGALPAANAANAVEPGVGVTSFVLTQVFTYLVVGWNGPNGGSMAYYIGDLNIGDTINLVPTANPSIGKGVDCGSAITPDCGHLVFNQEGYGVTHSSLLNPQQRVPDGGTTMSLLGLALAGIGLAARRIKK